MFNKAQHSLMSGDELTSFLIQFDLFLMLFFVLGLWMAILFGGRKGDSRPLGSKREKEEND